jgi:hypothetical protein
MANIWIIIIVIVVICLILWQIKIVHISSLPDDQKKKLHEKENLKKALYESNKIECDTKKKNKKEAFTSLDASSIDQKIEKTLKSIGVIKKKSIRSDLSDRMSKLKKSVDMNYTFNLQSEPVVFRHSHEKDDKVYVDKFLQKSGRLFDKVGVDEIGIRLLSIEETSADYILDGLVIAYPSFYHVKYYGKIDREFDFFADDAKDKMQLIFITEIKKSDYDELARKHKKEYQPFSTIAEQDVYAKHVLAQWDE